MELDEFQCRNVLLRLKLGPGLIVLAVGADGYFGYFPLAYHLSSFSLSLGDSSIWFGVS